MNIDLNNGIVYEDNYALLNKIIPNINNMRKTVGSKLSDDQFLRIKLMEKKKGRMLLSVARYVLLENQLVLDQDLVISLFPGLQMIDVLGSRDAEEIREVYEDNRINSGLKIELNQVLNTLLRKAVISRRELLTLAA